MTQHEIEELVREIGDEILVRLGSHPQPAVASSCGCKSPQAAAGAVPANGSSAGRHWHAPKEGLARLIDHTLLRPEASEADIVRVCAEARTHGFAAVCVQPSWLARAVGELRGVKVKPCTVVGFPHGAALTPVKCAEAEQAVKLGARELDMVVNIGELKRGNFDFVYTEMRAVAEIAHQAEALLKVILEMPLLTEQEKVNGCALAKLAGVDFVKTATGFGPSGAAAADVALLHRIVGGELGIKAAGGIRTFGDLQAMMASGATRIGTSAGTAILREAASLAGASAN